MRAGIYVASPHANPAKRRVHCTIYELCSGALSSPCFVKSPEVMPRASLLLAKRRLVLLALALCAALSVSMIRAWYLKPEQLQRLGTHIILEVAGVAYELLDNATLLPQVLRAAADAASLTVIDEVFHTFPVHGLSGLLLIRRAVA